MEDWREKITKVDITGSVIVGMHRDAPNPFAYTTLIYASAPSEERRYYTVDWNADGDGETGRRLFILGLNQELQDGFALDDINERRRTPSLYWLREDLPAFVDATGFYMEKDFRRTLEQEVQGNDIIQDPTIAVQEELYRKEITIGIGSRLAVRLAVSRWYDLLQTGTDKLLAHYFRTNEKKSETNQYVWFLENLAPFLDTGLMEEANLRKILSGKCDISGPLEDMQAILKDEVRHFRSREHVETVLASLREEILRKY